MENEDFMYYAGEPYGRVLEQFKALLKEPEFFVRLTGAQGSGKSSLLEQAMQYYQAQGCLTRYFPANPDSPMALRSALRKSFDLPKTHNFQRNLQEYLSHQALTHQGIVLIFDDCHLMNNATLLELTKLTDIQISNSCMLSIIMCGSDALDARLNRDHELRPVLQRITLSAQLPALDKKGTALFLRTLFDAAIQQDLEFQPQALTLLFNVSRGLPQRIIDVGSLCSNLYRSQELGSPVSKTELAQVLKHASLAMRGFNRTPPNRRVAATAIAATTLVAVAATAWIALQPTSPDTVPTTAVATLSADVITELSPDLMPPLNDISEVIEISEVTEVSEAIAVSEVSEVSETLPEPDAERPAEPALAITEPPSAQAEIAPQLTAEPPAIETPAASAEQALQNWVAAWQARDVDAYFSFYHAEFFPRGFDSLSAWQENRRRNIGNREWIALQISELSINNISEQTAQLEFWLAYQSPGYSDRTQKQVLMRRGNQGWQIVQEINLEIIY
ncbi:MAG: AAA family ATPase [Pseudohongiella sp.]|nr:AAA family ATPase [Pseudohongiella sp.]